MYTVCRLRRILRLSNRIKSFAQTAGSLEKRNLPFRNPGPILSPLNYSSLFDYMCLRSHSGVSNNISQNITQLLKWKMMHQTDLVLIHQSTSTAKTTHGDVISMRTSPIHNEVAHAILGMIVLNRANFPRGTLGYGM